ncbi:MAG: imidazole glycerol phosphate synthase subunit HisH [Gammaproteobacteria bacterium]|jgi:glutamine amidotransferase
MASITIIDYGMGNLHSIAKALEHVAGRDRVRVSSEHAAILASDRVVFPGVGAIRDCMSELQRTGLDRVIREVAGSKPLLCVCLGMQALLDSSDENQGVRCLGIIPGKVSRFPPDIQVDGERLKIPHMGWNQVRQQRDHPMWQNIRTNRRFYFVHSYYAQPLVEHDISATTPYGIEFASVIARDNVFAVQFHPEKSQQAGLSLLANFVGWNGES